MALPTFVLFGILLLLVTPSESKAIAKKEDKCLKLVVETALKCFVEPLNKKSCNKQNKIKKLKNTLSKLKQKDLTTLVDMCNACTDCKKDGKACVIGRLTLGAKNCGHLLKKFGKFGKK